MLGPGAAPSWELDRRKSDSTDASWNVARANFCLLLLFLLPTTTALLNSPPSKAYHHSIAAPQREYHTTLVLTRGLNSNVHNSIFNHRAKRVNDDDEDEDGEML